MNAAAFIAEGLTAMNRAAAPKPSTAIEAMERVEYSIRSYARSGRALSDEAKMIAWADDLRTAINQARGL